MAPAMTAPSSGRKTMATYMPLIPQNLATRENDGNAFFALSPGGSGIGGLRPPFLTGRTPMRSIGCGEGVRPLGQSPLTPTLSPLGRGSSHQQAAHASPFHQVYVVDRDRAAVAEIGDEDGEPDGGFSRRHREHDERIDLADDVAEEC